MKFFLCLLFFCCLEFYNIDAIVYEDDVIEDHKGTQGKKDETPLLSDNGGQHFQDIQADALSLNTAMTPTVSKETVMKEIQATESPVEPRPKKITSESSNDMSHYEQEEIKLVKNATSPEQHALQNNVIQLASLTDAGKIDTFVLRNVTKPKTISPLYTHRGNNGDKNKNNIQSRSESHNHQPFVKTTLANLGMRTATEHIITDVSTAKNDVSSTKSGVSNRHVNSTNNDVRASKKVQLEPNENVQKEISTQLNTTSQKSDTEFGMSGGQILGGQITGGQIAGGNIYGGQISGGLIEGGTIKGGSVEGGHISAGLIDGGVMMDGTVEGGYVHNGTIRGGDVKAGNVSGGVITGGVVLGGHITSGEIQGGVLKRGGVEGGILKGGTIDGGILKGGVMESGLLLGGVVRNGRVTGGTILGGEILGGEVGEGVVIRGGKINGTVTLGRKVVTRKIIKPSLGEPFHPLPKLFTPPTSHGRVSGVITPSFTPPRPPPRPTQDRYSSLRADGPIVLSTPKQPYSSDALRNIPTTSMSVVQTKRDGGFYNNFRGPGGGSFSRDGTSDGSFRSGGSFHSGGTNGGSFRRDGNNDGRFHSGGGGNNGGGRNSGGSSDGYRRGYFVTQPRYDYGTTAQTRLGGYPNTRVQNNMVQPYNAMRSYQKPLAVPRPAINNNGININQFVKQISSNTITATSKPETDVRPDYHWILNSIKNGQVNGFPGQRLVAQGGVRLNRASIGFDGVATFMDGGDYRETCVSDPNLCHKGLAFEMTIKVDSEATSYRDPRYILDTGASSFNSRGVSLYTIDNKLRADVAVRDASYCIVVPLTVDKWQDVVVTFQKDGELNMYINCKLVATVESDKYCINCHTPGCHNTDENTRLILGRANTEPKSNFAKFKAGDLSFYKRYLNPRDIDRICGISKPKPAPLATAVNYWQNYQRLRRPVLTSSTPRTQQGLLKSAISNVDWRRKKLAQAPYFTPWAAWSQCSTTCGDGSMIRQRSCVYAHAQSGWQTCHGVTFQSKKCQKRCRVQSVMNKNQVKPFKSTRLSKTSSNSARNHHIRVQKPSTLQDSQPLPKHVKESNHTKPVLKPWPASTKTLSSLHSNSSNNGNDTTVLFSRRNRISKILKKLGNLLGKL